MQAASNQLNPPYLLSLIYFLILLLFYFYLESRHYQCHVFGLLVLPLLIILTPVTKVYAIIPIFILSFLILFQFFTRRYYFPLILSFLALVISFLLFRIYCPQIKQNLIYRPFWFIDTMIDSPDRLYLPKFSAYRLHLQQTNPYDYRLTVFYLIFFAIFIVGNFGFRLLGLFTLKDCQTQLNRTLFFISIILVAFPTLFVQSHTNWNTIQFLYYALFIFNLFLCRFLSKSSIFWLILITISFIFANYDGYVGYLGSPPPANLPLTEIKALRFFSQLPPGIVLTYPYDNGFKEKATKTPLPLYIYETTSYLSAYTPHLTYLADEMNSANLGLDVTKRRQKLLNFFSGSDIFASRGFLLDNEIKYIYLTGYQRQQAHLHLSYLSLVSVYDDGQTIIYRVNR